jgi:hypothetical protein
MNEEYEARIKDLEEKIRVLEQQGNRISNMETMIQDILSLIDET